METAAEPLKIDDPEAFHLASKLAARTGKSVAEAVIEALRTELERTAAQDPLKPVDIKAVMEILEKYDKLPVYDNRTADEIIGYNEHGHFD